ncbi:MAG: LacI family transcriptional regulator [Clostridiales bacterium]|nr:LacI family transcriptional regulator [Clostridiales bacterium]
MSGGIGIAITSKDLAALCGVSQGTVDRALHNRPGISPKTREKILETAARLGYRVDQRARSLVKGRTMTLGVVLPDLERRFFSEIAGSIEDNARQRGYFIYLTLTRWDPDEEFTCVERLAGMQVDALILFSVREDPLYESYLGGLSIPVITVGNRLSQAFPFVGIDDYAAAGDAVGYILSRGYRRILYLSPPPALHDSENIYAASRRLAGCIDALRQAGRGVESWIVDTPDYLMKLDMIGFIRERRAAILCSGDLYALEVMYHLASRGVRIPSEVGVMGFEAVDMLRHVRPALSSVAFPADRLGARAVDLALQRIHGREDWTDAILEHRIVEGETL